LQLSRLAELLQLPISYPAALFPEELQEISFLRVGKDTHVGKAALGEAASDSSMDSRWITHPKSTPEKHKP